ncbi:hypothetical protein Syun_010495 [Stephania yunnanensis]|uniref:TF-B3 domain-containing protein n=1 Tax=Stephania yunnanensis TaxID=152371 RepID=A0AAP0PTB1_9MAGN
MKEESVSVSVSGSDEPRSEVHVFSKVLQPGFTESITIPTEFARDIVPLPETISIKLAGDRTWTVGIREEKDRLVLEDEWEDFVKENTLKLNDTLVFKYHKYGEFCLHVTLLEKTEYDHEVKVHAESLVSKDGAAGDCVAKTQMKETLDEDNGTKSEPVEEVQEEWTQLEFSGAAGRLIEGNASKIDPSSKQHKISKQRIRHREKQAKKRQRRDRDSPVRNRHEAPTRWHNPPSSTRRSGRDKGRGQKKEKTAPNKPAQEGEDSAEESGESYYVGATIEHDLTYATYFQSQRRAVTEEEVSKAFESACAVELYKPNFISVMQPSIVQRRFFMTIPQKLLKAYIPRQSKEAILQVPPSPKTWIVQIIHRRYSAGLNMGWADFVMDNNLEEGDACLFELCDVQECGRYLMNVSIHRVVEEITPLKKLQLPYCMRGKRTKE